MTKTRKNRIKTYVLDPVLTNDQIKGREGTHFDAKNYLIVDHDADVWGKDPEVPGGKRLLARMCSPRI